MPGGVPVGGVVPAGDVPGPGSGEGPLDGSRSSSVAVGGGGVDDGAGSVDDGAGSVDVGREGPGGAGVFWSGGSDGSGRPGGLVARPGRPGAVVGKGAGPLRVEQQSPWEPLLGKVLWLCGDTDDTLTAVYDEIWRVGPSPGQADLNVIFGEVFELRPGCGVEGAPLYAHVTWDGFGPPRESPQAATEAAQRTARETACLYGCGHSLGYGGELLGYRAPLGVFAVEAPADEVVLLWDTAALRGGELLGLVQNRSAALFARRVTVTWGEQESVFALTLQPGEVAPFVLDAAAVTEMPQRFELAVSAEMSPRPDLSRSFRGDPSLAVDPARTSPWGVSWVLRQAADPAFGANWAPLDPSLGPGDHAAIRQWSTRVDLAAPTSHPGAVDTETLQDLVIEDVRAYLTFLDEHHRVLAVHRLVPIDRRAGPDQPLRGLPATDDDGNRRHDFGLDFHWAAHSQYDPPRAETVTHIGGAGPWTRPDPADP